MKEQSGRLLATPLAYLDQALLCWRTSQGSLLLEQPELLAILPAWGTTVDGELFEHQRPAHLTSASVGFVSLKTPQASDSPRGRPQRFHQRNEADGRYDLPDQLVALMGDNRNSKPWVRPLDKPQNLENQIARLLPTPVVNDMGAGKTVEAWDEWAGKQKAADGRPAPHGKSLSIEVLRLLPTPQSWDSKTFGPNVDWKKRAKNHAASVASVLMNLPLPDGSKPSDEPHQTPPIEQG